MLSSIISKRKRDDEEVACETIAIQGKRRHLMDDCIQEMSNMSITNQYTIFDVRREQTEL